MVERGNAKSPASSSYKTENQLSRSDRNFAKNVADESIYSVRFDFTFDNEGLSLVSVLHLNDRGMRDEKP